MSQGSTAPGGTGAPFSGKALVVDDHLDNRNIIGFFLRRLGMQVEFGANGAEGVQKALGTGFDVVLMDLQMPVLDGLAATRQLREQGYRGAIIGLTADPESKESDLFLLAGCNLCLAKPLDTPTLAQALSTCMHPPQSQPIDEEPLASEFAEEEGILPLVKSYLESLEEMLAELSQAVKTGDYATATQIAHKIKGSGGMYGYTSITETAAALEKEAKSGTLTDISALVRLVKRAQAHPTIRGGE